MKTKAFVFVTILGAALVAAPAFAQPYIFPNDDQSAEQQATDDGACKSWAQGQTGVDPSRPSSPPSSYSAGDPSMVRGAARGAALGAVVGAIGGDAGKGAAMGAAGGGLFGGMRRRDQYRNEETQLRNWQAQQQQAHAQYMRAFGACMEGKNYTVK
ncbi:MAG: hypothetical protein ACI8TX_002921 [Hyphomicrobiaceae bacterium]|jgi:hypothetical protein